MPSVAVVMTMHACTCAYVCLDRCGSGAQESDGEHPVPERVGGQAGVTVQARRESDGDGAQQEVSLQSALRHLCR